MLGAFGATPSVHGAVKILVVDDDPVTQRVLAMLVAHEGYEPVCAGDGEEAWSRFCGGDIRLVITDQSMPRLDGMGLLRRIRSHPGPYTYTILLTAPPQDTLAAMAAGADDHLAKPVAAVDLRVRLAVARRIAALQEELARRNAELESANARMQHDLRAAQRAQRQLLPAALPVVPGLAVAWRLNPCEELAGDTLNLVRLDERNLGFYVLDVSGHGVSAALMAVQVSRFLGPHLGSLLKEPVAMAPGYRITSPVEVARRLNQLFYAPRQLQYCTLLYGVYDLIDDQVEMVCAAHPPPLVQRDDGRIEQPEVCGHPIGLFPPTEAVFTSWCTTLGPGDRLLAFSDGVTECEDREGCILGTQGLATLLRGATGCRPDACLDSLLAALEERRRGQPPSDDVSLLLLERRV